MGVGACFLVVFVFDRSRLIIPSSTILHIGLTATVVTTSAAWTKKKTHPKHFDKLFELMGVKKTWKPKHTPAHAQVLEVTQRPELGAQQSSTYRSAVGILLYPSCDFDIWFSTCWVAQSLD